MPPETAPPAKSAEETESLPPAPAEDDKPFSLADYVVVNALFFAFLIVIYIAMRALYPETGGLTVFYVLLAGGFVLVSIYDYVFDRLSRSGE